MKKRTRNNNQEFYDGRIENIKKPKEDHIINNDSDTLIDDENNNIKNYENEFKLFKLMNKEKLVIKKLQTIAKDNGLPFSGNENELYNRIEQYYNIKINSEKEVKQQQDNNPFNKSQPILLIKNENEIAFWKVFRNKSLFKMVFSNFKFSNTFNYSRLYSVNNIFKSFSNGIEIIRDKVKSNSYLSFIAINDKDNIQKFNFNGLSIIFENIKDENEENQLFYNQFITNYCNRTVHFWSLFDHVIESSNLLALKSLHGNGMIKEKVKVDFEINSYSNLKILNYLTKNLSKLFIIETIQVNDFNIFKEFKLGELIDFTRALLDDKKYYKLLKPFNNNKSFSRATKDIDDELSLFLENITKNKLILNEIKKFKFTDKELNENLFKVLKPLTNWDRHFSKLNHNYSSDIDNNSSINNEIENEKQRLSIIKLKNLELFQKIVNNNDILSKKLKLVSYEVHESIFSNIMTIQNDQIKIGKEMEGNFIEQNQLIQKIQEKQLKKQKEKENNTLQECKDDDLNKRNTIFKYITIFYDLNLIKKKPIEYSLAFLNEFVATNEEYCCWDDQLFEYGMPKNEILVNGVLSSNINNSKKIEIVMNSKFLMENQFRNFISTNCTRSLIKNVKSIDMLDFLFKNFQNQIFAENNNNWQYCNSVEILQHYEKLMESLGRKFSYSVNNPEIQFPLLLMAINNPFLYDDDDDDIQKKKSLILKKNISFNDFLLLIESNRFKKLEMRKSLTEFNNDSILISRWISDNCITGLSSLIDHGRGFNTYSIKIEIDVQLPNYKGNDGDGGDSNGKVKLLLYQNQLIQILYNSNRLDDIFKINSLSGKEIINFINFIGPHISLPFVEKLLQYLIDVNLNFEIYTFLSALISNGNLLIIKYLNLNHSHFFSKITKETEGFLEPRELKNLLSSSVLFDHVQIAEILFVYTNLTKGEFERSTKPSYSMIEFLYSNNFKLSK
ncbi:SAP DNA-binding domain-containing protein [Dictyostelium discoideum AX4]|uniref:SAP DNA-binding domain-containing protein n=1 Tax=Dictyostelium discoideum TaxID=44689 RepID=Q54TP0_DICDI|nr:SAP DNA-binding domain-containing protein [Dictyostelium discoideum AX4]EAL66580.1 SAP DNA-binding domain-containing protein [Dictyostelium discoideum AX4]|eukprot:XP_640551.1 SAP DNA-binding domain-containing protein [Dictyostelium discoideum AX4]